MVNGRTVGMLGDVVFETSDKYVKTISELNLKNSVKYAEHTRVGGYSLVEFVGIEPGKVDLKIYLSAYLGVNVGAEFSKLHLHERNGTVLPLLMGEDVRAMCNFVIQSSELEEQTWDGNGNMTTCTMTLNLLEYVAG